MSEEMSIAEALRLADLNSGKYKDIPSSSRTLATEVRRLESALTESQQEVERLRKALAPFAPEIFSTAWGGDLYDDASPVYGRNGVLLTLGDFRRASEAIYPAQPADCHHPNFDENGVCTLCKEFYRADKDTQPAEGRK